MRSKPPTLTDVARLAEVSVPTASRVLNGGVRGTRSGNPELRRRVEDAARKLGYSVSTAAQAIKDGRSRSVAMMVTDIDDYGAAMMISGVMHAAEERGMSVAVRATFDDAQREQDLVSQLRGERHRALILATSRTTEFSRESALDAQLKVLSGEGTRVVVVGDSELGYPSVTVDNRVAASRLAQGLVDTGLRRFALVTGEDSQITARDRAEGFLEGLASRGIQVAEADIIRGEFDRNGGYAAAKDLEVKVDQLDAISAMSDTMALGVIARLREMGLDVPGDVEVTGFDRLPLLGDVMPRFSTVEVHLEQFGEAALSLALGEGTPVPARTIALHATPIVHGVRMGNPRES